MKILEAQSAVLTNYEVYQHLNDYRQRSKQPGRRRGPGNLETLITELLQYFHSAPGPLQHQQQPAISDRAVVSELLRRIRAAGFASELAKGEMVMLINLRPASVAALNTAIDDMESRFSEEEQGRLLEIVAEVLGGPGADGEAMPSVEGGGGA